MSRSRIFMIVGLILIAAFSRILPHPPNFTPIMALALFGGAVLEDKRWAFLVPLAAMWISDLAIGAHALQPLVYVSLALAVCMGFRLRDRRFVSIATGAFASSVLFFLVTNFGVWVSGLLYPPTFEGLLGCYIAALPFFQNTLWGTLSYSAILFGGLALIDRLVRKERDVLAATTVP